MAKRKQVTTSPTTENKKERKERKRLKKEAKKQQQKQRQPEATSRRDDDAIAANVFFRKKLELTVSLLPGALGRVQKSIEDALRLLLLKYSDGLKGILLAFENAQIVSNNNNNDNMSSGQILNDLPHIHYHVTTDALVFCPFIGCELTGVVTEASFSSHLSLVVLHYFNASIAADQMRAAGFEIEDDKWYYSSDASSKEEEKNEQDEAPRNKRFFLEPGASSVKFTCQKIHESAGIISLIGVKPVLRLEEI